MKRSKERDAGATTESDSRYGIGRRSTNQRRIAWQETEKAGESGDSRSVADGDIATVARLREAVNGSTPGSRWNEIGIIFGSVLMACSIFLTLVTVLGVNARANRIIENEGIRARSGEIVVSRLEGKLDRHIDQTEENGRKLDILLAGTTTTTTTRTGSRTPVTRLRATTTTRVAPTTTRPSTTTTTFVAPTTTSPPCKLSLLNVCLLG